MVSKELFISVESRFRLTTFFNLLGIIVTRTGFAKTSCTRGRGEIGIDSSHDRLANLLALKLKMFVSFQR